MCRQPPAPLVRAGRGGGAAAAGGGAAKGAGWCCAAAGGHVGKFRLGAGGGRGAWVGHTLQAPLGWGAGGSGSMAMRETGTQRHTRTTSRNLHQTCCLLQHSAGCICA